MDPREIKPAARPNETEAPVNNALRMIPVTAADVAREKRRKVLIGLGIVLVLLVTGAWLYKRFSDPRDAREAYEAGLRLLRATRYDQATLNFTRAVDLKPDFVDAYRMRGRVYVADRVNIWLHPWHDVYGSGYQTSVDSAVAALFFLPAALPSCP